jgi:outer membrane protein assembly factor BamB/pSer/pThr/pTyr-binding forkhead associated (FHA) protein
MSEHTAMLGLEIHNGEQPVETLRISRLQPICIGRHASNDICIDDEDVAPIHCRVAWNGSDFEVAAANRDGVDVNGTLVRHSALKAGDVMRIGPADLFVRNSKEPEPVLQAVADDSAQDLSLPMIPDPKSSAANPAIVSGEVPLRPMTEDALPARQGWDRRAFSGGKPWSGMGERLSREAAKKPEPPAPVPAPMPTSDVIGALLEEDKAPESDVPLPLSPRSAKPRPLGARLSERLAAKRVRPGEQEALRSPIILGMLGFTLALGLAAAAIYFVIGRESTKQEFDAASAEFDAHHYGQSSEMFEKFIARHKGHALAADAQYKMWDANILKEIAGSSPAWKRGLDTVVQSIDANRDRKDFRDHFSALADFLTRIALGASATAQSTSDRSQLDVSQAAEAMLPRYFPDGKIPPELTVKLKVAYTTAQEAIIKHEIVSAGIADIEKQIAGKQPMAALAARRTLLAHYSEMTSEPRLASLLKQTLDVEKALVVREELNKPALPRPAHAAPRMLTLTLHARSRTEEPAGTRPVFVLAKDCCYAVDHVTGEPIWRRSLGLDTPFFPIKVETAVPGLLVFNSNRLSLMLLDRKTGEPIWEQPIDEAVSGAPLVDQGQIYLATAGRHLDKIDLETGRLTTRLTFSQKILSPPALSRDKERLIVAGDASLIYTLTTSPLSCIRVTDMNHAAGSLVNGVTAVGGLVLLTEPGRTSGTRLHVFAAQSDEAWLKPVDVQTVEGQVRDAPVIYGKLLFVSSVPARITAFTVSDTPGQEALTPTTSVVVPNQQDSQIFLSPGPDGQLWMAGSSVRQLQLKLNSQTFSLNSAEIAVGISSQPLQVVGQYLYAARRVPYAESVLFSEIDREPMTGQWRTVFGSSIIGSSVFRGGEIVTVGEAGEVFATDPGELDASAFKSSASSFIKPDPKTDLPLRATRLHDGRIAVDSAGPTPTVWFVGPGGQISHSFPLEKALDAPPVELSAGLVLPLPGRLRLVSPTSGMAAADDQLSPVEGGKSAIWKSVARVSDNQLVALDSRGRLAVSQYRTDPVRSLAEVVSKTLDKPSDTGLAIVGSRIVYATEDGTLHFLDAATLEPVAAHKLSSPAVGRLWSVGTTVLAETRDHELTAYETSGTPKLLFVAALGESGPSGPPASKGGRLIVAERDGTVVSLDPAKGTVIARVTLEQPLVGGVLDVNGHPVVTTIDGSLCRVDSVLEATTSGLESPKKGP